MPFVDAAAVEAQMHNSVRSVSRALTQTPSLLLLKTKTASSFLDSSAWNYYTIHAFWAQKSFKIRQILWYIYLGFGIYLSNFGKMFVSKIRCGIIDNRKTPTMLKKKLYQHSEYGTNLND